MKISARNLLKGKIKELQQGPINAEVVVELTNGDEIVAIVTRQSADNLELAVGKEVYAVIKASNVMLATD